MAPIDLGTTRLADKLQGAVGPDIFAIANEALRSYTTSRTAPVVAAPAATYQSSFGNKGILILLGILALLFFVR